MLLRSIGLAIVFAATFVVIAKPAISSEDRKGYPGMFCETYDRPSAIRTGPSADIFNTSTTTSYEILCPAITDSQVYPNSIERAVIVSNSSKLVCTLYTRQSNGDKISGANPDKITHGVDGFYYYYFGDGDPNITASLSGYIYFDCTLPPLARIFEYIVYENEGES